MKNVTSVAELSGFLYWGRDAGNTPALGGWLPRLIAGGECESWFVLGETELSQHRNNSATLL
jgi:hypothetical protein